MEAEKKVKEIISKLKALNFEERNHQIKVYDEDYPLEVSVSNINVPCIADCRQVAEECGVPFKTFEMFNIGVFEIE
jgi:hypothetical protein